MCEKMLSKQNKLSEKLRRYDYQSSENRTEKMWKAIHGSESV